MARGLECLAEGCPIPDTDDISELGHIASLRRGIRVGGREKPDADPVADWKSSSTSLCMCLWGRSPFVHVPCLDWKVRTVYWGKEAAKNPRY